MTFDWDVEPLPFEVLRIRADDGRVLILTPSIMGQGIIREFTEPVFSPRQWMYEDVGNGALYLSLWAGDKFEGEPERWQRASEFGKPHRRRLPDGGVAEDERR